MINYFSYSQGLEKCVEWKINNRNAICYVSECSKSGGVLPQGIHILRNCKSIEEDNKRLQWNAINQVHNILNLKGTVADFIYHWKKITPPVKEDEKFIIDEEGKMKGICFDLSGKQTETPKFTAKMPSMYALVNKTDIDNANYICFYGDKSKLEECTHIAMHLCGFGTYNDKTEFVFFTPVPKSWYDENSQE